MDRTGQDRQAVAFVAGLMVLGALGSAARVDAQSDSADIETALAAGMLDLGDGNYGIDPTSLVRREAMRAEDGVRASARGTIEALGARLETGPRQDSCRLSHTVSWWSPCSRDPDAVG